MPLPNRVDPFGALIATPARGTLMGNRGGRFHDPDTRAVTGRPWASRQWICCELSFKGRRRHPVWGSGYTELFFLDEVTALTAGHRPCFECRRAEARAFAEAARRGLGLADTPRAPDLDARLHAERRGDRRRAATPDSLPDAAMALDADGPKAKHQSRWLEWNPSGWRAASTPPPGDIVVLTPPTIVAALAAGYRPRWHPSAAEPETLTESRSRA